MEKAIELNEDDSEEYEIKAIHDSEVYAKKLDSGQLSGLN